MVRLVVEFIPPPRWWNRAHYRLEYPTRICRAEIPAGFISDGATVPRLFWPLFPPMDRAAPAAFLHDYLLTQGDRRRADLMFLAALRAAGVARWRAAVMFAAARVWSVIRRG